MICKIKRRFWKFVTKCEKSFLYTMSASNRELEHAPQLTQSALIRVCVLLILGIISLIGNIAILFHIIKTKSIRRNSRRNSSAIYTLMLHLAIADLLVTIFCIFGGIIGQIVWNIANAYLHNFYRQKLKSSKKNLFIISIF